MMQTCTLHPQSMQCAASEHAAGTGSVDDGLNSCVGELNVFKPSSTFAYFAGTDCAL